MHGSAHPAELLRIVAVPSADAEFARCVREAARGRRDVAAIEEELRLRYPKARLRTSELSGNDAVLYAYRDGHWQPPPRSS